MIKNLYFILTAGKTNMFTFSTYQLLPASSFFCV